MEYEYDAFISHASEDKDAFVRPLVRHMTGAGLNVWYDEFSLRVGDSLRQTIEKGLAKSRFGVVVLSPAFLEKRWPQQELNGLAALETADGRNRVLPVWLNLRQPDVAKASPMLADRVALSSDLGIREVAEQLSHQIRSNDPAERAYRVKHEDQVVDLVEIARNEGGVINGHWFLRCRLVGPAILAVNGDGMSFVRTGFHRPMFFSLVAERPYIGFIPMTNCRIEDVEFDGVGIAGPSSFIDRVMMIGEAPDGPPPGS